MLAPPKMFEMQPRPTEWNAETADVLKHLGDSLAAQWRCYRKGLKRCQRRFPSKAVHDSRIAARRLLSTIELFGVFTSSRQRKKITEALKHYLDSFSELRDTQVQLVHVNELTGHFAAARVFRTWLEKRESRFTRRTRKAIKRTKTKRLGGRIAKLKNEILPCRKATTSERAFDAVLRSVNQAFARATQLRRHVRADDTKTIHRTRVAFKRFRYMLEVLSPLLPAMNKGFQNVMREHQALMGEVQDATVLLDTFTGYVHRKKIESAMAKRLRNELAQRQRRLIQNYLGAADELKFFRPSFRLPKAK
jgi:CHAD domain-containing protein